MFLEGTNCQRTTKASKILQSLFENSGSQMPKTRYIRTSRRLRKEHISSAHYISLSTTQRL